MIATARAQGSANVIVQLAVPQLGALTAASSAARGGAVGPSDAQLGAAIAAVAQAELAKLRGTPHSVRRTFTTVPFLALTVSQATLQRLEASAAVLGVTEDRLATIQLDNTTNIVGASSAADLGFDGSGLYVAILDTGIRAGHNFFTGKTIRQACFALGQDGAAGAGDCPNGLATDTASADAARHHTTSPSSDHGTHVAGIAAGKDLTHVPPLFGVARGANVIAVQVFSQFHSAGACGGGDCLLSWTSDQIAGLDYVYSLRSTLSIAAANLSLGSGAFSSQATCDASHAGIKAVIDNLRSANIATVIAAGNDGSCAAISGPACVSSAVAVGATSDSDVEVGFSNFHSALLDLHAPGASVLSSIGTSNSAYGSDSGTSMSAAHVTGAWGVMRDAFGSISVTTALGRLQSTGQSVIARCGGPAAQRRIRLDQAIGGVKFNQPPSGAGEALASNTDWSDQAPNVVVADDLFSDGRPITALRWWGTNLVDPPPPSCPASTADCCAQHTGRGCNDAVCCSTVCGADAFCCNKEWDSQCAVEAQSLCADCGSGDLPTNDDCADATQVNEGAFPFSNIGAITDGSNSSCTSTGADVWFNYVPTCDGTATVTMCAGTGFDTTIEVYNGCSCVGSPVACNDDECGKQSTASFAVTTGACFKVRVGGYAGAQGIGSLAISCTPASACPPTAGDCCVGHVGPGCSDPACCSVVCVEFDPFCCDTAWESSCADAAQFYCTICGGGSAADAAVSRNGSPEIGEAEVSPGAGRIRRSQDDANGQVASPTTGLDGWLISFHEPLSTGGPIDQALGVYFCDASAVRTSALSTASCDGLPVTEHSAVLANCCRVRATTDSRSGATPAQADGFHEEQCFAYAVSIQAVVGRKFVPNGGGGCTETVTGLTAAGDVWGWRTTDIAQASLFGLHAAVESGASSYGPTWLYGPWQAADPPCSEPHMAFALLTNAVATTDTDSDGNGVPDACNPEMIPAASEWTLLELGLALLIAGTLCLRRARWLGASASGFKEAIHAGHV